MGRDWCLPEPGPKGATHKRENGFGMAVERPATAVRMGQQKQGCHMRETFRRIEGAFPKQGAARGDTRPVYTDPPGCILKPGQNLY